jgi:hypothetical protein
MSVRKNCSSSFFWVAAFIFRRQACNNLVAWSGVFSRMARTHKLSSLARIRKIVPTSLIEMSRIKVPRRDVVTTNPSRSNRSNASLTGPRETPSLRARSSSMILWRGRNRPAWIACRRCDSTFLLAGSFTWIITPNSSRPAKVVDYICFIAVLDSYPCCQIPCQSQAINQKLMGNLAPPGSHRVRSSPNRVQTVREHLDCRADCATPPILTPLYCPAGIRVE